MPESAWTNIVTYGTRIEADIARATLEGAGVQVILRGDQAGIFGAGFAGWAPGGATIAVPNPDASRALELLDLPPA
ncbi:MAG: DUF2007 domain-containing protein [Gemmatimonadota bacterium]